MRLNLGCGSDLRAGYVNLDVAENVGADVVHDIDVTPWPFEDEEFHEILAQDVFEHVNNPIGFMREVHRTLRIGGKVVIKVPYWRHKDAFTDPTHKRFCTENTFDYWIEGTVLKQHHGKAYGDLSFKKDTIAITHCSITATLVKL